MDILLTRRWFTKKSTISEVTIDGASYGYILEDRDRGLNQTDTLAAITKTKVYGLTAIPAGRYEVVISFSNRFKKLLPLVSNVPGFEGIRIHPGNDEGDSLGCLLPGTTRAEDFVGNSRVAWATLYARILLASKSEKVYAQITRNEKTWGVFSLL